jgi:Xaa-Pro aminopeptidase
MKQVFNVSKAKKLLSEANLDAIVATAPENVFYSTGSNIITMSLIRRLAFFILPRDGDAVFGVNRIEMSKAKNTSWIKDIRPYAAEEWEPAKVVDFFAGLIKDLGLAKARVGLDVEQFSAEYFGMLTKLVPEVKFVNDQPIFDRLRAVKTPEEVKRLSDAAMATAKAITIAFEMARVGDTERDVARNQCDLVFEFGADNVTACVLGSGESNLEAHHLPVDKKLKAGEILHTDFCANFEGYGSDISRTAVVGRAPNADQKKAYDLAIKCQNNVVAAMRAGAKIMDVHNAAKKTMEAAGFEYTRPFIGHSVGVGIHDYPFVGPVHGDWVLEPNMVFEIEPGVNIGKERVHTEDTILVTGGKAKNLSQFIDTSEILVIK